MKTLRHMNPWWAVAALITFGWLGVSAATEPAQIPLSSRVAAPPPPNVVMTIDDSGSMLSDFMPAGDFKVNGIAVRLAKDGEWFAAFPGDWRKLCQTGQFHGCGLSTDYPVSQFLDSVVTSLATASKPDVYQYQYRSPDVNPIFYNPDKRYLPWFKADGSGRMPNANPAAALWDPVITNATFNLSINYLDYSVGKKKNDQRIKTTWSRTNSTQASETLDFYPGAVYRLTANADPTKTANYQRYDVNDMGGNHAAPGDKNANRTDCAGKRCTQAEELQNFANWFTYYRMRETLTKAAVGETFTQFKDKLRVGWARINNDTAVKIDGSAKTYARIETEANGGPLRPLDAARLNKILTGVYKIASWPSTPLRFAVRDVGNYFSRTSDPAGSPWLTDPTNSSSEKLACRRSVNVLMTDGYYNDKTSDVGIGNVDGVDGPKWPNAPKGAQDHYIAKRPYDDAPNKFSTTLSDVAMKYFVNDLDTNIDNKVVPLPNDIAYWQHLTQFMVGLGVTGTLDSSTRQSKDKVIEAITKGDLSWPDPTAGEPQKIDDMWHASFDTGGDFHSARDVTELTSALANAFDSASGNEAKEAGVATASAYVVAGNVKYVPKYKPGAWWGDLEAWPLSIDGEQGDTALWLASDVMPLPTIRNLYTWQGSKPSVLFTWDTMDTATRNLVGSEALTKYTRGDETNTGQEGVFRQRFPKLDKGGNKLAPLGDLVNSPPVLVKGLVDLGYESLSGHDKDYPAYVKLKKDRTDGVIFVGGNDGILHAFRSSDGKEVYGFLPRAGLSQLKTIASKDYGKTTNFHRFVVDGPLAESDAFITPPGATSAEWSNLLIGTMGAGGKSIFALHVPTQSKGTQFEPVDLGANTVMWEVNGDTDKDIGYVFADLAVGKIKGGGWKAFVGNGVYSTNGNAVLLVIDLETGVVDRLVVDSTGSTGLMGVSLIKDVNTQEVVGAYAGDLKGNLWRIEIKGDKDFKVGFDGKSPLFHATADVKGDVSQPITIAPSMVLHPEFGRVVLFGTGRLIDETDSGAKGTQTFYGVWDTTKVGESSDGKASPFDKVGVDRTALQVQTTTTDPIKTKNGTYFAVTTKAVDWKTQLGWLMDLPFPRQRVIFPAYVLAGEFVFISTSVPATEAAICEATSGAGYNYLLKAADGTAMTEATYDTNGDGKIDEDDLIAGGFLTGNDGRDAILNQGKDEDGESKCVDGYRYYMDCHTGKVCERVRVTCTNVTPTLKDRLWKQILNPPVPAK